MDIYSKFDVIVSFYLFVKINEYKSFLGLTVVYSTCLDTFVIEISRAHNNVFILVVEMSWFYREVAIALLCVH